MPKKGIKDRKAKVTERKTEKDHLLRKLENEKEKRISSEKGIERQENKSSAGKTGFGRGSKGEQSSEIIYIYNLVYLLFFTATKI